MYVELGEWVSRECEHSAESTYELAQSTFSCCNLDTVTTIEIKSAFSHAYIVASYILQSINGGIIAEC